MSQLDLAILTSALRFFTYNTQLSSPTTKFFFLRGSLSDCTSSVSIRQLFICLHPVLLFKNLSVSLLIQTLNDINSFVTVLCTEALYSPVQSHENYLPHLIKLKLFNLLVLAVLLVSQMGLVHVHLVSRLFSIMSFILQLHLLLT